MDGTLLFYKMSAELKGQGGLFILISENSARMAQMAEGWQEQLSSGSTVWGLIVTGLLGTPFIASKTSVSPIKIVRFLRGG